MAMGCGLLVAASAVPVHASGASGVRIPARISPHVAPYGSGVASAAENWAGYAETASKKTFTAITGTFTVPTVDTNVSGTYYSSDWVGIGGFSDDSLIQAGVEADSIGGNAYYGAWTEVLPASENPLAMSISPGDTILVTIIETAKNTWKMSVSDTSIGKTLTRKVHYKSSGSSAEAIMERPCIQGPCDSVSDLANLAQTTPETFEPVLAATSSPSNSPGYEPLLSPPSGATLEDIVMVNNAGSGVIATPSDANSDADGFTVADGSAVPAAP
jgi:hypothetical protein